MAQYQPVSRQAFAGKCWQRSSSYQFAAGQRFCPVLLTEVSRAMMFLPLAFVASGEQFVPVVLQALQGEGNAVVAPDGRWLLPYVPAYYRAHPFRALRAENDEFVLCFDMESQLLADSGEAFFQEDGSPAPALTQISNFLQQCEADRQRTAVLTGQLQQLGLIAPWPIKLQDGDTQRDLQGYYRIDETALNALSGEAFLQLRQSGALVMVYSQLLSMQHLSHLAELERAQAQARAQLAAQQAKAAASKELDLSFMSSSDTLNFGTF